MCVATIESELERMESGGCPSCQHYGECKRDLKESKSFSDSMVGRRCVGFSEKKRKVVA